MADETLPRQGRVAVITGGGRGLGKAFAVALAGEGAQVALLDIDGAVARSAAAEIGPLATAHAADVTDETAIASVMAEIAASHGGIDILINNAGLHAHAYSRPILEMGLAKARRLLDVNIGGTLVCTLAAEPYMRNRDGANIVNIASSAAYGGGLYGNSKLAVIGLTITCAREFAPQGIRVNAIAPGIILTDTIRSELPPETISRIKSMQFLSDDGSEQDIVEAALFLTSAKARFITGETLRVSGGFMAGP